MCAEANTVWRDLHTVTGSLAATQLQTRGQLYLDIHPYLLLTIFFFSVGTPQLLNIISNNDEEDKDKDKESDEDENKGM